MTEVHFNDGKQIRVEKGEGFFVVDGLRIEMPVQQGKAFQLMVGSRPAEVYLLGADEEDNSLRLMVNGKKISLKVTTELDALLKKMGIEAGKSSKAAELKAPMPGLIHSIKVNEGDEVKKGEPLVILEAMKMENIIKAPADVRIRKIHVKEKTTVDKGAVMISFG